MVLCVTAGDAGREGSVCAEGAIVCSQSSLVRQDERGRHQTFQRRGRTQRQGERGKHSLAHLFMFGYEQRQRYGR